MRRSSATTSPWFVHVPIDIGFIRNRTGGSCCVTNMRLGVSVADGRGAEMLAFISKAFGRKQSGTDMSDSQCEHHRQNQVVQSQMFGVARDAEGK
jgi:hypothetical protein